MGFGTDEYGGSEYGGTSPEGTPPVVALHVVAAWYESTRDLLVRFSIPVQQRDPYDAHDALNLLNWSLTRADGGEAPVVLVVEPVAAETVRLVLAGALTPYGKAGTVTASVLLVDGDFGVPIGTPRVATLNGVLAPPPRRPGDVELGFRDLREAAFGTKGGVVLGNGGDYQLATSAETLQKMIYRVISTVMGSWVYAPTLGGKVQLKHLMRDFEVDQFSSDTKRRLQLLPDVVSVQMVTSQDPRGVFYATANVKTKTLGPLIVNWPGSGSGGDA